MNVQRGDVVLVWFPFASGTGGKLRPALVVQTDRNNQRLVNTIVAQITSTTRRTHEPTQLLVEIATPDGKMSGLLVNSAVKCEHLATLERQLIQRKIGVLSPNPMARIDESLKTALGL